MTHSSALGLLQRPGLIYFLPNWWAWEAGSYCLGHTSQVWGRLHPLGESSHFAQWDVLQKGDQPHVFFGATNCQRDIGSQCSEKHEVNTCRELQHNRGNLIVCIKNIMQLTRYDNYFRPETNTFLIKFNTYILYCHFTSSELRHEMCLCKFQLSQISPLQHVLTELSGWNYLSHSHSPQLT